MFLLESKVVGRRGEHPPRAVLDQPHSSPVHRNGATPELADADPRIRWLWCNGDGVPACSHIYFLQGQTLVAWQSYFDKRMSFLKPNVCTRMAAIRWACAHRATRLNLGATPDYATGLAAYKKRWGGRRVFFPVYVRHDWGLRHRLGALIGRWHSTNTTSDKNSSPRVLPAP